MAMRMIDYVQSIIASTPLAEKRETDFDQEKWDKLALEIKKLYSELNLTYHIYHLHVSNRQLRAMMQNMTGIM